MFDILFGWRKASKCKKLIRKIQCRLKLLKNKRCSIVRQLREDVAELLKLGHDQSAFNRVEQLFMDESIVAVYDLLDHFCEFIIIHLSYIRRHKDCPNDINEAVSSLIFASARCGDLPELRVIRKLFGERYGHRFAEAALELLPGNLVNRQIKENLSIESVRDDAKYRLVDEIARSCLQTGPLAIEYSSELQQMLANKSNGDQVPNGDVQNSYSAHSGSQSQASNITEAEGKIVHVDISSEGKKILTEPCNSHQDLGDTGTSTKFSTVPHSSPNTVEPLMFKKHGKVESFIQLNSSYESTLSGNSTIGNWSSSTAMAPQSSSESSSQMLEEIIYLDDIEEFQPPLNTDGNYQDQRLFMFKSSVIPTREKFEIGCHEDYVEKYESWNEKADTRNSRKRGKAVVKKVRKRSFSWENRGVKDVECTIYYGKSCEHLPNQNCKFHHGRKHQKKMQMESRLNGELVNKCSLEHPCYACVSDDEDNLELESPPWKPKRGTKTLERSRTCVLEEENFRHVIYHCRCSCSGDPHNQGAGWVFLPQTTQNKLIFHDGEYVGTGAGSTCSCSRGAASLRTRKETQAPYLRAMTMPPERPKDNHNDNIIRSNSFPYQQRCDLSNGSSSSPHVHPKLPDYDELAAKFMALKKENLQNKNQ